MMMIASLIDFLFCAKYTLYIHIYLHLFNSHKTPTRHYYSHILSEELETEGFA